MTDPINPDTPVEARFVDRHIGPGADAVERMLATVGYSSVEDLLDAVVPESIRQREAIGVAKAIPGAGTMDEAELLERLAEKASRIQVATNMIGAGWYGTRTPPVIQRNMVENPAWYTAYTPYQPEISQGRLEMLLNFQTVVSDLCGMDMANASMLDEATAAAEAMTLARRQSKAESNVFCLDSDCHPQVIDVVRGRAEPLGIELAVVDPDGEVPECFGILLAYPGSSGAIADRRELTETLHASSALVCVCTDLLALTLLTPPGEWGADVVVGSAQRFGVPMGFGGPHAGFMAVRESAKRSLPGRLVGVSVDAHGNPAVRLALQTREQHIRREKATSNICTAQVLLANVAAAYAAYHGAGGLTAIAQRVHSTARAIAESLTAAGLEILSENYFDTLTVSAPGRALALVGAARDVGINLRPLDEDRFALSVDETTTSQIAETLVRALGARDSLIIGEYDPADIPPALRRQSDFLTHPNFSSYRSETEMMRYLRRLSDADLALDRTMIPLGSCTMKLNAAVEMMPITWPEFSSVHPYAPAEQMEGYLEVISELESALCLITGYDAVSLQPNAGSQGELAGLLAISAYHRAQGDEHRNICLIPASAHGTNAASAVMAGMKVVVVATDDFGNIDTADLSAKASEHSEDLAAAMVTYPSTHGVFEETIAEVCRIVHDHGAQVYVDGANLNALVGVARPGVFGADVSHLNLHKTFCIPHGGGGPGVGPVAARAHLAPYLPGHASAQRESDRHGPTVSAAPYGSAGILPISWTYIALMGDDLVSATALAILSANYISRRLREHFPVLYAGRDDLVAHECILDLRAITKRTGITAEDVAKRLIDYGFHAPTLAFPVAGTLMVEPTESESLAELDLFCDAMISIAEEIQKVEDGVWPSEDNPLVNAPHTAESVTADTWEHPYTRSDAAWPPKGAHSPKYWAPVGRIDGAHGDRNLVCACPPIEAYET